MLVVDRYVLLIFLCGLVPQGYRALIRETTCASLYLSIVSIYLSYLSYLSIYLSYCLRFSGSEPPRMSHMVYNPVVPPHIHIHPYTCSRSGRVNNKNHSGMGRLGIDLGDAIQWVLNIDSLALKVIRVISIRAIVQKLWRMTLRCVCKMRLFRLVSACFFCLLFACTHKHTCQTGVHSYTVVRSLTAIDGQLDKLCRSSGY